MAKRVPKTRVLINGRDVTGYVYRCNLPRFPDAVDCVELVLEIDKLEVDESGALIIRIDIPEE